jgi:peptidoglycan hydrolase CwlO-like protein
MLARLRWLCCVLLSLSLLAGCSEQLNAFTLVEAKEADLQRLQTDLDQLEEEIKELPKLQYQIEDLVLKRDRLRKQVATLRKRKP